MPSQTICLLSAILVVLVCRFVYDVVALGEATLQLQKKSGDCTFEDVAAEVPRLEETELTYRDEALSYIQLNRLREVADVEPTPFNNMLLCTCAKCGSTSLYTHLYESIFGRKFPPFEEAGGFVQQVRNEQWKGIFNDASDHELNDLLKEPDTYSIAVIRDPIQRVVSAWKSKFACGDEYGTNVKDRARLIPHLMKLADLPTTVESDACLSFSAYLRLLHIVHQSGRAPELDAHILPQHMGCFRHSNPSNWTYVTVASDPDLSLRLSEGLGILNASKPMRKEHGSPGNDPVITGVDHELLEAITREERRVLGQYLP